MITKEMFMAAYRDGFIEIVPDPYSRFAICKIGDTSIFSDFLDGLKDIPSPNECKSDAPENDVLNTLYEQIQEIGAGEGYGPNGIYSHCEEILLKRYPDMAKSQNERALALKSATDEELVYELLCRESCISDSAVHSLLKKAGYIAWNLWSREDIADELTEKGYSESEENIDAVINTGYLESLSECDDRDWEIISSAIRACESELEPEPNASKKLLDARTERFETMELFGRTVLFTDMRIDRNTVPDGLYLYGLRYEDDDSEPATIECGFVGVNHFGDILSDKPFDLPDRDDPYLEISDEDWGYLPDMMTVKEYLSRDKSEEGE